MFAYDMSFTRLSTHSTVTRLVDSSPTTTSLQSATHYLQYLASTYRSDNVRPLSIILTCADEMPLMVINLALA